MIEVSKLWKFSGKGPSSVKTWQQGPRGGHYYISASGAKVYGREAEQLAAKEGAGAAPGHLAPELPKKIDDPEAWAQQHQAEWEKTLSKPERAAFLEYTEGGYANINRELRESGGRCAKGAICDKLDKALSRTPGAPHAFEVMRGMNLRPGFDIAQFKEGGTFTDHGFMSTAIGLEGRQGDVIMHIDVPKGTKGAYMGKTVGGDWQEQEWLMPRNTKLQINKIEKQGGKHVIYASVLG